MRATLNRAIKEVTGAKFQRKEMRVQSKIAGSYVTNIQFRMGNKFYRQEMADVPLPTASIDVVAALPGASAVAKF